MVSVDVVVLSKDRPDLFTACLAHVVAQEVPYQGWLVDNGTDGKTAEVAERHGWNVISPGRNTGFSEGNNLAFAASSAERVLLLNNDACLHPGALSAMLAHDDGIVGAVIVNGRGVVGHAGGVLWRGIPKHRGRGSAPSGWVCHSTEWVTFAAALISRDAFAAVGGLDEGYWYGFEDVDFCLAAQRSGFSTTVCADAVVTHDESQTRGPGGGDPGNRERFYRKWPTGVTV